MSKPPYVIDLEDALRSREPDIERAAEVILKTAILTGSLQAAVVADDQVTFNCGDDSNTLVVKHGRSKMRMVLARLATLCRTTSENQSPAMLLYGGEGELKMRVHGKLHLFQVRLQNTTASQCVTVTVGDVSKLSVSA